MNKDDWIRDTPPPTSIGIKCRGCGYYLEAMETETTNYTCLTVGCRKCDQVVKTEWRKKDD